MKVYVGSLTAWQKAKLLTTLYDNIAAVLKYSPMAIDHAKILLHERKNQIRYAGSIFIGVDFGAKDGYIDIGKYNEALLKDYNGRVLPGEKALQTSMQDMGLATIKPQVQSLHNACDSTVKPYVILSLPKGNEKMKGCDSTQLPKPGHGVGC